MLKISFILILIFLDLGDHLRRRMDTALPNFIYFHITVLKGYSRIHNFSIMDYLRNLSFGITSYLPCWKPCLITFWFDNIFLVSLLFSILSNQVLIAWLYSLHFVTSEKDCQHQASWYDFNRFAGWRSISLRAMINTS